LLRRRLDTSLYIRVLRDRPADLRERLRPTPLRSASTIALTALLQGAAKAVRPDHSRREVERLAAKLEAPAFDEATGDHAAGISSALEHPGGAQVALRAHHRGPWPLGTDLLS